MAGPPASPGGHAATLAGTPSKPPGPGPPRIAGALGQDPAAGATRSAPPTENPAGVPYTGQTAAGPARPQGMVVPGDAGDTPQSSVGEWWRFLNTPITAFSFLREQFTNFWLVGEPAEGSLTSVGRPLAVAASRPVPSIYTLRFGGETRRRASRTCP